MNDILNADSDPEGLAAARRAGLRETDLGAGLTGFTLGGVVSPKSLADPTAIVNGHIREDVGAHRNPITEVSVAIDSDGNPIDGLIRQGVTLRVTFGGVAPDKAHCPVISAPSAFVFTYGDEINLGNTSGDSPNIIVGADPSILQQAEKVGCLDIKFKH